METTVQWLTAHMHLALCALAALALHSQAAELKDDTHDYGRFSAGFVAALGLALHPQGQPWLALALFLPMGRGEMLAGIPAVALVGLARLLPLPAGAWPAEGVAMLLVYLGLREWQERRTLRLSDEEAQFRARRLYRVQTVLRRSLAVVALLLAALPPDSLAMLALLPLLLATHRLAENNLYRVLSQEAHAAKDDLKLSQARLKSSNTALEQVSTQLQEATLETRWLEFITQALAADPEPGRTLDTILALVGGVCPARSIVIYIQFPGPDGPRLLPVRYSTPQADELLQAAEPMVEHALRSGTVAQGASQLFRREAVAAALPLSRVGVLYLGREEPPFTALEQRRLSFLAEKASASLAVSLRLDSQRQELARQSRLASALTRRVSLLGTLVEGLRSASANLELGGLVGDTRALLANLVPHDFGLLVLTRPVLASHAWGVEVAVESLGDWQQELPGLCSRESLPFALPGSGPLLVAQLRAPAESLGLLLVGLQSRVFREQERELFSLIAYQVAVLVRNALLLQDLKRSHQQLVQASKLSAIGQLASGVAHELNSPLAAITLALESARMLLAPGQEAAENLLISAEQAAESAQTVVDGLLAYARKSEGERERLDPAELCARVSDFLRLQLKRRGVALTVQSAPGPAVEGRLEELRQVLVNLILNAADAAREVELRTRSEAGWVVLGVRDRGPGIPPEELARIFDPFYTTKATGTGLGLPLSREIVTQHGGRLEVRSQPGQGSLFEVWLPAAAQEAGPVQHFA